MLELHLHFFQLLLYFRRQQKIMNSAFFKILASFRTNIIDIKILHVIFEV